MNRDGLGVDSTRQSTRQMILYPDIFKLRDCNDNDQSQSEVASAIPLAKSMGAKLSSCLNEYITNILCDVHCDALKWHPFISMNIFNDCKRGASLHEKLMDLNSEHSVDIVLVSPAWIRSLW
jgi:hypothetical protein